LRPLPPGDVGAVLDRRAPGQRLEVEIGCGNGHFLEEYCSRNPGVLYLGIELKAGRCEKACRKIERRGLANAYVIEARAEDVLGLLPESAVDVVHIYFPDPWPKSRHRRRRFLRMPNLDRIALLLAPGGRILFATDYFDYYLHTKLLFALHPRLEPAAYDLPRELFGSVFGKRFAELGKPVRLAAALRREPGAPWAGG
jgi:tRNA (guanine-N7-)-methyltransferase